MRISIKVITGAKKAFIKQEGGQMKVYVTSPPLEGRANEALVVQLAEHFKVKKSAIEIVKGLKSQHKVVNIFGI